MVGDSSPDFPPVRSPQNVAENASRHRPLTVSRIYLTLAGIAIALLFTTLGVGLSLGPLRPQLDRLTELSNKAAETEVSGDIRDEITSLQSVRRQANLHRLMGIGTGIMVMLVNCIAVTYFVGTSRWCREVVQAYKLDTSLWGQSASMKRRTFFWSLIGMLSVLVISSLGALSDPMAAFPGAEQYITFHLLAAMIGIGVIAWSFFAQWSHIIDNHEIIGQVLVEVERIRKERGLDPDGLQPVETEGRTADAEA